MLKIIGGIVVYGLAMFGFGVSLSRAHSRQRLRRGAFGLLSASAGGRFLCKSAVYDELPRCGSGMPRL